MTRLNNDYWPSIGLGITQIVGYGTLLYAYAILLPHMADDLGLTLASSFGLLSLALFFGGFLAPIAGHLTDRFGGRTVMTLGSVAAGIALMSVSLVEGRLTLFLAILFVEAAAMFVLYPVAFASIARLDLAVPTQRSISIITLFGGVASTIFWPLTLAIYNAVGWQETWVILGVMMLATCVPIHYFVLSRPPRDADAPLPETEQNWPELRPEDRKRGMLFMVISFVFAGYLMGAVMTLWVTNVQDLGHSAAMAALAGAVIGPFKTVGRFFQMLVSRNMYPLVTYALSLGLMLAGFLIILAFGFTLPGILIAAAVYGMGDGIKTIASGTLPLALFGRRGYGARLGWINFVQMGMNASAPFAFAWVTQSFGGWWSFAAMTAVLSLAAVTYFFIPDPRRERHATAQNRRVPQN